MNRNTRKSTKNYHIEKQKPRKSHKTARCKIPKLEITDEMVLVLSFFADRISRGDIHIPTKNYIQDQILHHPQYSSFRGVVPDKYVEDIARLFSKVVEVTEFDGTTTGGGNILGKTIQTVQKMDDYNQAGLAANIAGLIGMDEILVKQIAKNEISTNYVRLQCSRRSVRLLFVLLVLSYQVFFMYCGFKYFENDIQFMEEKYHTNPLVYSKNSNSTENKAIQSFINNTIGMAETGFRLSYVDYIIPIQNYSHLLLRGCIETCIVNFKSSDMKNRDLPHFTENFIRTWDWENTNTTTLGQFVTKIGEVPLFYLTCLNKERASRFEQFQYYYINSLWQFLWWGAYFIKLSYLMINYGDLDNTMYAPSDERSVHAGLQRAANHQQRNQRSQPQPQQPAPQPQPQPQQPAPQPVRRRMGAFKRSSEQSSRLASIVRMKGGAGSPPAAAAVAVAANVSPSPELSTEEALDRLSNENKQIKDLIIIIDENMVTIKENIHKELKDIKTEVKFIKSKYDKTVKYMDKRLQSLKKKVKSKSKKKYRSPPPPLPPVANAVEP